MLYLAPAMASHIHAIIHDAQAFCPQTRALFITRRATCRQTDTTTGGEHPVPRQARIVGELAERSPNPARCATQTRRFGELPVSNHVTCRHHHQG